MANQKPIENVEDVLEESVSDEESEDLFVHSENQCHLCRKRLNTKDELFEHVQKDHEEYYNGLMEVAAYLNTSLLRKIFMDSACLIETWFCLTN